MLEPITYKQVLGKDGSFEKLELWQGANHITVSLAGEGTHKNYVRWDEIKEIVESLANKISSEVAASVSSSSSGMVEQWMNATKTNKEQE